MDAGGFEYLSQGAEHYPREYLHALQRMIEHHDADAALAVAGMLCAAGHAARVWRCYLRLYFRLGLGVRYPYLVQNLLKMQREAAALAHQHAIAIDILTRATRAPLVLALVFQAADQMGRPASAGDHVQASMHMLCTPEWMSEWSRLLGACTAGVSLLPAMGTAMLDVLRVWRADGGHWHYGPWKYVAATLAAFLYLRMPCDWSHSTDYSVRSDLPHKWPEALPADRWPEHCRFPAHRQPAFGWRLWGRRAPRSVSERVGAEQLPGVRMSSAAIARVHLSVHAVMALPEMLGLRPEQVCGFETNFAMHLWPSRTSGVIPPHGLGVLEEYPWVSVTRMADEDEARDAEESYRRAAAFVRGAESAVRLLPVVRRGAFLVAWFVHESCLRAADRAFFEMARALEPHTGMPVHAGSFVALDTGETLYVPFAGTQRPVPDAPVPAAARALVDEMFEKIKFTV